MEKKLHCVIVDDDQHAIDLLRQLIDKHPYLKLIKTYTHPLKALAALVCGIDILFLDIDMPGMNGIELAGLLRQKVRQLVFVTAHAQFALRAYEVSADQYLIKPLAETDFFKAIERLKHKATPTETGELTQVADDCLYVKGQLKGYMSRIPKMEITHVSTIKGTNYLEVFTPKRCYKTNLTIRALEEELKDDARFMRISRSTIIRLASILDIKGNTIILDVKTEVIMGDEYRALFMDYVKNKLSNG